MSEPLINILIRVSRPDMVHRCFQSIKKQTHKNYKVWMLADNYHSYGICMQKTLETKGNIYINEGRYIVIPFQPDSERREYFYNKYCNRFLLFINSGFIMFLDDDDILADGKALERIAAHLTDEDQPVICQMLRNGNPKPSKMHIDRRWVVKGHIGMPCLVLHSKHKGLHEFGATEDADYQWIKTVSEKLKCKFVEEVLVDAGSRNHGAAII